MQRDAGGPDPADEFERIVAGWRRERSVPAWPDDQPDARGDDDPDRDDPDPEGPVPDGGPGPADGAGSGGTRPDRDAGGDPDGAGPPGEARDRRRPGGPPPGTGERWTGHGVHRPGPADPDDDHFVPPEPPPLPPVGPPFLVGAGLLVLGIVLLTAPWWVGVPDVYGLPLGLVTVAAGLGWLVLRLWPDPPTRGDGDGPDDGAQL